MPPAVIGDHAEITAWHWSDHGTRGHNSRVQRRFVSLMLCSLIAQTASAQPVAPTESDDADVPVRRTRDARLDAIFRGPFQSSRLFTMPTADTVGAYMLTLSGDGSLLQETGVLTSAGVLAIGFGDIAQLEYRHTAAISVTGVNAPLPAVGAQLRIPLPRRANVPAIGVAFRLGVPRREVFGDTFVDERVTDLFVVTQLRLAAAPWLSLHGGVRYSPAQIVLAGDRDVTVTKSLLLPAGGVELEVNRDTRVVAEVAFAPRFEWMAETAPDEAPQIQTGLLARVGVRWAIVPAFVIDGSIGYQNEVGSAARPDGLDAVVAWDIRLGAEVFVPWGALACRATGAFCD